MDRGQRRRHSSALVVSFLSNHVPWLEVKTGGLSGPGRFIFRLRWPGSPATPRDGTRSAASPKKSKIRRKITIRKRIKSTIKIKSRTSCTRPANAGRPALPRAPDPTPAPPLALSPLPDLTLHLSLSLMCEPLANPPIADCQATWAKGNRPGLLQQGVSFRLIFVLWLSLRFFRKAAGRSSRRWISVSSLDWLCFGMVQAEVTAPGRQDRGWVAILDQ